MSTLVLTWALLAAQTLLGLSLACAAWRVVTGPRAQDRILGLDSLYVTAMLMLLVFGMESGRTIYFEAALVIALGGFAGTAALAKFIMRGEVIEMIGASDLPGWAAIIVALLTLAGAIITLAGAIGLVRFETFYDRLHPPTLGSSGGTILIVLASILCFSVLRTRLSVHEVLIGIFVTVTTPVTFMLLARASLYRDRVEGSADVVDAEEEPGRDQPG